MSGKANNIIVNLGKVRAPSTLPEIKENDDLNRLGPDADGPKHAYYHTSAVAFVDILGFKEIIKKSEKSKHGLVQKIYTALSAPTANYQDLFVSKLQLQNAPVKWDVRVSTFSDCILVSVPVDPWQVGLLLFTVHRMCRTLLERGFATRGGIAQGKFLHVVSQNGPSLAFGPALVEAYGLESTHAGGPRIILQNTLRQYIQNYVSSPKSHSSLSTFFSEHVRRSADGPAYVDLFADFRNIASKTDIPPGLQEIRTSICEALNSNTDRPQIFVKLARLAQEFNLAAQKAGLHDHTIPPDVLPR